MKAEALRKFSRILGTDERKRIVLQPILQSCKEKAKCSAAREYGQRGNFWGGQGTLLRVAGDKALRSGPAEAAIGLEAPRIDHHGKIVSVEIIAGEVEVDEPGNTPLNEEYV